MSRRGVLVCSGILIGCVVVGFYQMCARKRAARKRTKKSLLGMEICGEMEASFVHSECSEDEPTLTEDASKITLQEQESQNLLNLLYTIAEDQARKEGFIHRGITCNSCSVNPIRGIRYKCANCVDHDLCESCESQDRHNKTHVFIKIRIPIPPLANPRSSLLPLFYPGGKQNVSSSLAWDMLRKLQKDTHFDQVELEALYEQFKSLSTVDSGEGGIDKDTFEQCLGPLGVEKNLITERIFSFFDQDGDGIIDFRELVGGLSVLCKGTQEEKIQYAFKGYDLDSNGFISRHELHKMFKAYFYLSMELVRDVVKALEEEMFANFNDEGGKPVSSLFTAPIPRDSDSSSHEKPAQDEPVIFSPDAGAAPRASLNNLAEDLRGSGKAAHRKISSSRNFSSGQFGDMWPVMEEMSQDAISEMVENAFKSADLDDDGFISFEEFQVWAATDSTMIAWFEALGSVF
eukprot:Sdes_comp16434_c0_seq1m5774